MTKLEMAFISDEVWDKVRHKAFNKTIPRSLTGAFTGTRSRAELLGDFMNGTYSFSTPTMVSVPKDNGGFRDIFVYDGLDRLILSAYTEALYRTCGNKYISKACVAYIEDSGILKVIRGLMKSSKSRSGFKADLTSYFTSIPKEDVLGMVRETGQGSKLSECVERMYGDPYALVEGEKVEVVKGVGQGCAPAAFFSNMYLKPVDDAMLERYPSYRRYSDDIIVFDDNPEEAFSYFRELLETYRPALKLNPDKVKLFYDEPVTFLGWVIDGEDICLSNKHFDRIKKRLKSLTSPALCKIKRAKGNDVYLRRVVAKVMKFLYFSAEVNDSVIGYANQSILGMTRERDIRDLSEYVRNRILKEYTGKFSSDANTCVSEEKLKSFGYISLYEMWSRHRISHDLYTWSVKKIQEFFKYKKYKYTVESAVSFGKLYSYILNCEERYLSDPSELFRMIRATDPKIFEDNDKWFLVVKDMVIFKGEMLGFAC